MKYTIPEHLRNPAPRPWWRDNELSGQARSGYPKRHERTDEWAGLVAEIRAEIAGGAVYAADVVAMVNSTAQYWTHVHHRDVRARIMADRHYSRQSPGSPEFTAAGNKIVLLHFAPDGTPAALWASHRPAPGKAVRADGRDAWDCSLFRIEQRTVQASDLIREAVAITRYIWNDVAPQDGFYTTVNPKHVAPIRRRGRDVWGYSYIKAGWTPDGYTKARGLIILSLSLEAMLQIVPIEPMSEAKQLSLLEAA